MNLLGWTLEIAALILFIRMFDTNPTTAKVALLLTAIVMGIGGHILRVRASKR